MRGGDDADRYADQESDQQRRYAELKRSAEELPQLAGHRLMRSQRVAEVERERRLEKIEVLHRERAVETELLTHALDLSDARLLSGHGDGRVSRDELQQDEHRRHDPQENGDRQQDAAHNVAGHLSSLILLSR